MKATIRKLEILVLLVAGAAVELLWAHYIPPPFYLDFSLIVVLYVAWYSTPLKAATCGIVFGLLGDMISGLYLGLNGLSKTVLGFITSHLSHWMILEGFWGRFPLIGLLSLCDSGIVFGILRVLQQPVTETFWWQALVKTVVTGVAGGIFFQVYDRMKFPPKDFRRLREEGERT